MQWHDELQLQQPRRTGQPHPATGLNVFTSQDPAATYTAKQSITGGTDKLMVDFLPDGTAPAAARACADAHVPGSCFMVIGNNNGVPCVSAGSTASGNWTFQAFTTDPGPYATFMITFGTTPAKGGYGVASSGIVSASAVIQPGGQGTSPTCNMTFPAPKTDPTSANPGFIIELTDMTDPAHPHGDVSSGGASSATPPVGISLNIVF